MHDTPARTAARATRLTGALLLVAAGAVAWVGTAWADAGTPDPTTDLQAGDDGFFAGTYQLQRSLVGGVDTVTGNVQIATAGGAEEVSLCLKATPYTDRVYGYLDKGCTHWTTVDDPAYPSKHVPSAEPATAILAAPVSTATISAVVPPALASAPVHVLLHVRVFDTTASNATRKVWRNGYAGFLQGQVLPDGTDVFDQHGDVVLEPIPPGSTTSSSTSSTSSSSTSSSSSSSTSSSSTSSTSSSSTTSTTEVTTTSTTAPSTTTTTGEVLGTTSTIASTTTTAGFAATTTTKPAEVLGNEAVRGGTGTLPRTGGSVLMPLAASATLATAGCGFLLAGRRRSQPKHLKRG